MVDFLASFLFPLPFHFSGSLMMLLNPFSAARRYKHHQNKVRVKGLVGNSSYLAGFSIFFLWFCEKVQSIA